MTILEHSNVRLGSVDDELVPVLKCVCGATFGPWQETISIEPDHAQPMPCCGRRLFFRMKLTVYEVAAPTETEGA